MGDTDPRFRTTSRPRLVASLLMVFAVLGATAFGGGRDAVVATDSCEPGIVGTFEPGHGEPHCRVTVTVLPH